MRTIAAIALLALASTTQAVQVQTSLAKDDIPYENEFAMCTQDQAEDAMWDNNVAGFYADSDVRVVEGADVKKTIINGKGFTKPMLVVAYHPQCPHCKTVVPDFKALATELKKKNAAVEVVAVNMSMEHTTHKFEIESYPTIRYYTKAGEFTAYKGGRKLQGFETFLTKQGIKL